VTARFVTTDGLALACRRIGSGPLLVCHCGGPGFPVDAPERFRGEVSRFLAA
jgi:hypothetical protein